MRKSRRQIVTRIFEATGFGVIALNLAFFFALYRPLANRMAEEQQLHRDLRQQVRDLESRVELLNKFQTAMPKAAKELDDFAKNRTPDRRQGFSTAAHLIQKVAEASGVKTSSVGFHLEVEHKDPLERLGLDISAQGTYPGLLKFAHGLETADDFILVRQFAISPLENGSLNLHLNADLYLTP